MTLRAIAWAPALWYPILSQTKSYLIFTLFADGKGIHCIGMLMLLDHLSFCIEGIIRFINIACMGAYGSGAAGKHLIATAGHSGWIRFWDLRLVLESLRVGHFGFTLMLSNIFTLLVVHFFGKIAHEA